MASNNLFATLKDGSKFPKVAFGTGTSFMSDPSGVTQSAVAAWDVGYRHFDTAKMYGTEGLLGEAINIILAKEGVQRSDLFVTSKIQPHVHKYEDVVDHVNDTLDKLQLTYIDIMMLHGPGPVFDGGFSKRFCSEEEYKHLPRTPEEIHEGRMASWRALQDLKKEGKIKNIGVSNFSKKHLEALANDDRCTETPAVNQIELHPYLYDEEIVRTCRSAGILVQAFSPIGSGTVGGRDNVKIVMEDPEIKDIALSNKISQGQVCLAWVLAKGAALVTKSQNEGRMKENLEAQKIQLPKADIDRIDRLTANKQRLYLNPYSIA